VNREVEARRFAFLGDRHAVRIQATVAALDVLRRRLGALAQGR
jgi:nicotinamide mononucleotide (NMN) deamidase PncC